MSRHVPSNKVFDAVAVSSTTTYYSGSTVVKNDTTTGVLGTDTPSANFVTFVGKFTSTPNGTLTVEISNSSTEDIKAGNEIWSTYTQVSGSGFTAGVATVTSGQINSAPTFALELKNFGYRRVRLTYTNATSSGTLTAIVTVKAAG